MDLRPNFPTSLHLSQKGLKLRGLDIKTNEFVPITQFPLLIVSSDLFVEKRIRNMFWKKDSYGYLRMGSFGATSE